MAVVPALMVASAAVAAVGAVSSGIASKNAADYQAQVANNNAIVAQQNAEYALKAGSAQAENQSRKGAANLGRIKTAIAAGGVDVNSGSALDTQVGQRETNQLDTETVLNNAQLQAYGYRTQQTNFESEAKLDTMKGEAAETSGYLKAGGDLLSSASSIGGKWTGFSGGSDSETPMGMGGIGSA